ncbi:MAG: response regulator [Rhodobacterales bacterium]|nr:response regulator [Rhodobacterales bacterium]
MPIPPDSPRLMDSGTSAVVQPLRGVTVLLVEDSRHTCDALRLIFQRSGARLRRAETLATARAHLGRYRPDLVIVDLGLPDGRGEIFIAEAAENGLAVLALSGDPDGRGSALEAGAVAFLDKPIMSVAAFLRLVRQLVAGFGAPQAEEEILPPAADPAALRDDLVRAAALLAEDGGDLAYATGFVRSLARAAGDIMLEEAALQAASAAGQKALADLLTLRLGAMQRLGQGIPPAHAGPSGGRGIN